MDEQKLKNSSSTVSPSKKKHGRPPKKKTTMAKKKSYEIESKPSELLVKEKPDSKIKYSSRVRMANSDKVRELLLQNVSKTTSRSFTQYTKSLVKQYMQNPQTIKIEFADYPNICFGQAHCIEKLFYIMHVCLYITIMS